MAFSCFPKIISIVDPLQWGMTDTILILWLRNWGSERIICPTALWQEIEVEGWLPIPHGKKQFGCSRAKEKPQTSLLADMTWNIYKFKLSEKAIFTGACLHISNSFNIHRKINIRHCLDLKLSLNLQAKIGPMKSRTRLFFQSGKPNQGVSNPSMIDHCWDYSLIRKHLK